MNSLTKKRNTMLKKIIPIKYHEKCINCGYNQIRTISCTKFYSTCPKCKSNMKIIKKIDNDIKDYFYIYINNILYNIRKKHVR